LTARAQQPPKLRIGVTRIRAWTSPIYVAFNQRLHELGYIEGKNLTVDLLNPHEQTGAFLELRGVRAAALGRKISGFAGCHQPATA
jgi:hypothetical protein